MKRNQTFHGQDNHLIRPRQSGFGGNNLYDIKDFRAKVITAKEEDGQLLLTVTSDLGKDFNPDDLKDKIIRLD